MFGLRKVMKFKMYGKYPNVRGITDGIILSLMKYPSDVNIPATYCSSIKMKWFHIINGDRFTKEHNRFYVIRIYQCSGNQDSIVSPSCNKVFRTVIANDELETIMDKFVETK